MIANIHTFSLQMSWYSRNAFRVWVTQPLFEKVRQHIWQSCSVRNSENLNNSMSPYSTHHSNECHAYLSIGWGLFVQIEDVSFKVTFQLYFLWWNFHITNFNMSVWSLINAFEWILGFLVNVFVFRMILLLAHDIHVLHEIVLYIFVLQILCTEWKVLSDKISCFVLLIW